MSSEHRVINDGLSYDLWANKLWLPVVLTHGGECEIVLRHILSSQTVWLLRVEGESPTAFPEISLSKDHMESLIARWRKALEGRSLDEVLQYNRIDGTPMTSTIGDIVRHVINHGTYHRGHLRGLLDHVGGEHLPSTDLIGYGMGREFSYSEF